MFFMIKSITVRLAPTPNRLEIYGDPLLDVISRQACSFLLDSLDIAVYFFALRFNVLRDIQLESGWLRGVSLLRLV